jgi:hypothetical protein
MTHLAAFLSMLNIAFGGICSLAGSNPRATGTIYFCPKSSIDILSGAVRQLPDLEFAQK